MDNAMVQDLLDNFVMKNETNFDRVSNENPILYSAVIDALDFLSNRFGSSKNIPQKEVKSEEDLPFKVGDTFIKAQNPSTIYEVDDILNHTASFKFSEGNGFAFNLSIEDAKESFESGKFVKVEPKSADNKIKVGDIFQDTIDDKFIVKLTDIKVNEYEFEKISDENFNFTFDKAMVEAKVKDGIWKRVEPKSADDEIKLGDLFQDSSDDQTIFRVFDIKSGEVYFEKTWDGKFAFKFVKDKVRQKVKNGDWKKVTEVEVFDILYPKKVTKATSVTKTKKATLSKEIKELKEAIDGLEAVENFLEDNEKKELAELRKKLSDLQQKNS